MHELSVLQKKVNRKLRPSDVAPLVRTAITNGYDVGTDPNYQSIFNALIDEFIDRSDAYSDHTIRRLASAWKKFVTWCTDNKHCALPSSPDTVESFLIAVSSTRHRNTIKVYLWSISKMHSIVGCPDPCDDLYVKTRKTGIEKRKIARGEEIKQATPFRLEHLNKITSMWEKSSSLKIARDLSLLHLAYESLLRESEITRIQIKDITFRSDGKSIINVPYTKNNKSGDPESILLSKIATMHLKNYIKAANVDTSTTNYLYRSFRKGDTISTYVSESRSPAHITAKTVERIFNTASAVLQIQGRPFTGHSARVGAAQDLAENGYSTLRIQLSGRWKDTKMVALYCRNILASENAMAHFRE